MQVLLTKMSLCFFFFNDTATTEIYTLSLHDALPISYTPLLAFHRVTDPERCREAAHEADRKSTRLNSSHGSNSYAVFCLKKKTKLAKLRRDQEDQKSKSSGSSIGFDVKRTGDATVVL